MNKTKNIFIFKTKNTFIFITKNVELNFLMKD